MKENPKPYDIALVHGYTDSEGYLGNFDNRNYMQIEAAQKLLNSGYVEKVLLAGGHYWGTEKPTYAQIMADELINRGVNPERLIIRPETTTTEGEIEVLLDEIRIQGAINAISISTRSHKPRIRLDYLKKGRGDIHHINSERVLFSVRNGDEYPFRDFLKRFRKSEKKFIIREAYAITFDVLGLGKLGKRFSDSKAGQALKAKIDG